MDVIVTLSADMSAFHEQAERLASLALEAGDIPECILEELRLLVEHLSEELLLSGAVPAGGAGNYVIRPRFKEGGRYDACMAALRALRDGR